MEHAAGGRRQQTLRQCWDALREDTRRMTGLRRCVHRMQQQLLSSAFTQWQETAGKEAGCCLCAYRSSPHPPGHTHKHARTACRQVIP